MGAGTGRNGLRESLVGAGSLGFDRPWSPWLAPRQGPIRPGRWACAAIRSSRLRESWKRSTWARGSLSTLDVGILPATPSRLSSSLGGGRAGFRWGAWTPFRVTSALRRSLSFRLVMCWPAARSRDGGGTGGAHDRCETPEHEGCLGADHVPGDVGVAGYDQSDGA